MSSICSFIYLQANKRRVVTNSEGHADHNGPGSGSDSGEASASASASASNRQAQPGFDFESQSNFEQYRLPASFGDTDEEQGFPFPGSDFDEDFDEDVFGDGWAI